MRRCVSKICWHTEALMETLVLRKTRPQGLPSRHEVSCYYGSPFRNSLRLQLSSTRIFPLTPGDHAPAKLRSTYEASLKALGPYKVNIFYLHMPDRSVPYEDTLREVNELYKEGLLWVLWKISLHFWWLTTFVRCFVVISKEFGLSNFNSWEVAEIYYIAKSHGWVLPTVYQGIYNALQRSIETECVSNVAPTSSWIWAYWHFFRFRLIPCLHKFGIRFYAYSPLAYVDTSRKRLEIDHLSSVTESWLERYFPQRTWTMIRLVDGTMLFGVRGCVKNTHLFFQFSKSWKLHSWVSLHGIVYMHGKSWFSRTNMTWHSRKPQWDGSSIIVFWPPMTGWSSEQAITHNLNQIWRIREHSRLGFVQVLFWFLWKFSEGGPLPADILELVDQAWFKIKGSVNHYAFWCRMVGACYSKIEC